jgi:hypothetical protein
MMKVDPGGVKGAAHVVPVGWTNDSFVAKAEYLAASDEVKPAFGGAANLRVGFANVPNVLIGRPAGHILIEEDSRILGHRNKFQPAGGLNVDAETELGEVIRVVYGGVTEPILALRTIAKLSAELNPMRE